MCEGFRLGVTIRLGSFAANRPKASRWGVIGVRRTLADDFQGKMFEMDWDLLVLFCLAMYLIVSVTFATLFYISGVRVSLPLCNNF